MAKVEVFCATDSQTLDAPQIPCWGHKKQADDFHKNIEIYYFHLLVTLQF